MKTDFRQGFLASNPNIIELSNDGLFAGLNIVGYPVYLMYASGDKNYLTRISNSMVNVWGPFSDTSTKYLFVDINQVSGESVFSYTNKPLITSSIYPQYPTEDQTFWHGVDKKMYVYTGQRWKSVLRVFIGEIRSGNNIVQYPNGSQVGIDGSFSAGYILFDTVGNPIKDKYGNFLTSETEIFSRDTFSVVKLEGANISVIANENIPAFSACTIINGGVRLASGIFNSDDFKFAPICISDQDVYQNDVFTPITAGKIISSQQWNWDLAQIGKSLYCSENGQLVLSKPSITKNVRVGIIVDHKSVLLTFDWETDIPTNLVINSTGGGSIGPTGPTGPIGETGAPGDIGPAGLNGPTGPTGPAGNAGPAGNDGGTGPAGPQGIQGIPGVDGADGIDGAIGPTGPQGIQGQQGVSVTLQGSVATAANLPATGNPGDGWIVQDSGDLYFWNISTSAWNNIGQIVGPKGDTGNTGAQGPTGSRGPTGPTGAQGPAGASGAASTVAGPTGPQGIQGLFGPTGPTGNTGAQGSTGATGPTGAASTVAGPTGPTGSSGAVGPTGAASTAAGPTGPTGPAGSAGPTGPGASMGTTSTNRGIPVFTNTTATSVASTNVTISATDEIAGYKVAYNAQTGTSYTVVAADAGKLIDHSNAAAITVTLPNNLPAGFFVSYLQAGNGQITFSAASGATIVNRTAQFKTAGQWAVAGIFVRANASGTAAQYVITGDLA